MASTHGKRPEREATLARRILSIVPRSASEAMSARQIANALGISGPMGPLCAELRRLCTRGALARDRNPEGHERPAIYRYWRVAE